MSGLAFVFHMSAECGALASALWVRFRRFVLSLLYLYHCFAPRIDIISSWWRLVSNFKMKFGVKYYATMFAWHHRRNLQDSLQSRYYADLEFFLSCTALFDVPISVLLFGCRSTPIIRIIAGKQCGWQLDGSVYGCCGVFNEAGTIKPFFFLARW